MIRKCLVVFDTHKQKPIPRIKNMGFCSGEKLLEDQITIQPLKEWARVALEGTAAAG